MSRTLSLLAFVLALVAAPLLSGCADGADGADEPNPEAEAPERRALRVETLQLEPTTFTDVVSVTGTVEATDDATLSAQSSGTVVQLKPLGAYVRDGGTVAQLDPVLSTASVEQAEAALEAAQAQLDLAQDNFERLEPLYADSIISASEFQATRAQRAQAQAQVAQARAGLAQARKGLANTRVTSPFGGTVEEHFVERGEQVAPGAPIARVVNTNVVKVRAGIPERYATDVEVGTSVEVRFGAYGGATRTGEVTFVGSAIDPASRTFPVEIALPNPDNQLKPAMVAQLELDRATLGDVLVVPQSAIVRDESGETIYVAAERNGELVAQNRSVVTGPSFQGNVVIEQGLEAGELVLVAGQTTVAPGDRLDVTERYTSLPAAE